MSTIIQLPIRLDSVRGQFPILDSSIKGRPLVYLDNAATSQKPECVIDAIARFYESENSNVHRGVHWLSQRATDVYERARKLQAEFLNASSDREIIFTKGTTEAINLVAQSWGSKNLKEGDVILLSQMEHHSNIVPWQMIAERTGAVIATIPISDRGELNLQDFADVVALGKVKIVSIVHVSNALGTINPVKEIISQAHSAGAVVLVDGAQAVPHLLIDVQDLDVDFYVYSGHKLFGPTGIGVLYGKRELLDEMPPYQGGGDMIHTVSFEKTTYAEVPAKFEAGTPPIAQAVGLGAAVEFIEGLGLGDNRRERLANAFSLIQEKEDLLLKYATQKFSEIRSATIRGTSEHKSAILSFTMENAHPHDIGTFLDEDGIAIRTGHHCCMPLMRRLKVPATARASFAFYNTLPEVDALIESVLKVEEVFK